MPVTCERHRAADIAPSGRVDRLRVAMTRFIDRRLGLGPGTKLGARGRQPEGCADCAREAARRHHLKTVGIIAVLWVGIILLTVLTSPRSLERAIWGAVVPSLIVGATFAAALLIWRDYLRNDSWIRSRLRSFRGRWRRGDHDDGGHSGR
ncbi:hypothetical protein ACFC14_02260 [Microbacterium sp. NPDC055988]|uniref:hypothetical protein n=1 Tax=Microbacterium sp. NPDC055988 TaxID=3345671 RepID=UPI0035E08DBD